MRNIAYRVFQAGIVLGVLLCGTTGTYAAKLSVSSSGTQVAEGGSVTTHVSLDTQGASINAVQGTLTYPAGMMSLERINDGDSIVNFWIHAPAQGSPGTISFAGIIPGGYNDAGPVFSVVFKAAKTGTVSFGLENTVVLENDGKGTSAPVTEVPASVTVSTSGLPASQTSTGEVSVPDHVLPEAFTPMIESNAGVFDGKWFIVFSTEDKGTGIDHYEVCEGDPHRCVRAENPYVLTDQALDVPVYVKAVDREGNVRVVTVPPHHTPWYKSGVVATLVLILALVVFALVWGKIWRKKVPTEPS